MRPTLRLSSAVLVLAAACLAPREPLALRWFRVALPAAAPALPAADAPTLRLLPVTAAPHLDERLAWRVSDVEYGHHELLRWLEEPSATVERGLVDALFTAGVSRRGEARAAASLAVELRRFEELRGAEHVAEVELAATLTDAQGTTLASLNFASSAILESDDPAELVRVLGQLLAGRIGDLTGTLRTHLPGH